MINPTKINLLPYNSYNVSAIAEEVYFPKSASDIEKTSKKPPPTKQLITLGSGTNIILIKAQIFGLHLAHYQDAR
ncbi:hypothetical protein D3C76_858800 [compost metagenome]